MDEKFFAWNLDINDQLTTHLSSQVCKIALFVAVICFVCNLAYNYITSGFSKLVDDSDNFPNYTDIARAFVLILCISSYIPIATTLVGTMEAVNKMSSSKRIENIVAFYNMQKANQTPNQENATLTMKDGKPEVQFKQTDVEQESEDGEDGRGFGSMVTGLLNLSSILSPANFVPLFIHMVTNIICFIIKIVVTGIAVLMTKILVILGPLAFAFSILPTFKRQLEQWFSTLTTTCLTLTTLNILDSLIDAMTGNIFAHMTWEDVISISSITGGRNLELIAYNLVVIVLYCSAFWLTSKVVGKGDAGRVLSKAVGAVTTMASIAIGAAAAGAVAGGDGGALKAVANLGKKTIENGEK